MKTSFIAIAASLIATPALAQGDSTIVVTGELEQEAEAAGRLGLTVRETPASIDIVTQENLQEQGVRNLVEALNAAPGVASGTLPGSMGSVSMRGFHRAVNYLYDGVRMANSDVGIRNMDSWAFERIEVIKGPSSVTSGEGALAGAINFVPRRPQLGQTSGEILASYGSFDTARLAGDVNVALGETVAARANASWSRTSGWIDDTDSDTFAISGGVLFQPTERFKLNLSADYYEDDYNTIYYGTPVISAALARDPSNAVSGSAGLVLDRSMRRLNFNVADGAMGSDNLWLRARSEWELTDTLTILSDTTYYSANRSWADSDEYSFNAGTGQIDRFLSLITHDHEYASQRLQVSWDGSIAGMRNRLTVGGELSNTDFFTKRRFRNAASVDPFKPARGVFPATDTSAIFGTRQDVTADVDSIALFAENALNLTPDWLLVGGLRWDNIEFTRSVFNVTSGATTQYGQNYDPISWRVGSVYNITPRTQLYGQYSYAVTPLSGFLFISATNANFRLTTGDSWEAGVKTSLSGTGVELTGSVFRVQQDNILTRDPTNPAVVLQGGTLRSEGIEVALNWPATEELSIGLSGTLLDAGYVTLIEAGGADRSGNRPQNVPERLADLVVTYAPSALPLRFTASARHNGGFFTSNANTVKVNAFTTFDAAVTWEASFADITLRGRNLTDQFYADWSGYASGLVFIGAPANVELSVTKRF